MALRRIEFLPKQELLDLWDDRSPLTVAFEDPVLRQAGLRSGRLGDAIAFFDLTVQDAHYLLCDCHYQGSMTAAAVAARMRSIAHKVTLRELWNRMRGRYPA